MHQIHPPRRPIFALQAENSLRTVVVVYTSIAIRRARSPRMSPTSGSPRTQRERHRGLSSWVIDAWSPVTNQNYTMTCLREGDAVICRGGNDAAVFFYIE